MDKDTKQFFANLIFFGIPVVFGALAVCSAVFIFTDGGFSVSRIVNSVIIFIIFAVIVAIMIMARNNLKFDKANSKPSKTKKQSVLKGLSKKEKAKKILSALAPLLIGLVVAGICFGLAGGRMSKMQSSAYVKTQATVVGSYVDKDGHIDGNGTIHGATYKLVYMYYDENGVEHYSDSSAEYGGMIFKTGKQTTIYYNRTNPEIIMSPSDNIFLLCTAVFFLGLGLMACFGMLGIGDDVMPILLGLTFLEFVGLVMFGMMSASGMNLFEIATSGALGYAMLFFAFIGAFIFIYSVVNIARKLVGLIRRGSTVQACEQESTPAEVEHGQKEPVKIKKKYRFNFRNIIIPLFIGGLAFFAAGASIMICFSIIPLVKSASYQEVYAVVTKLNTYRNDDDNLMASYEYEYEYGGKTYHKESSFSQSADLVPDVGEKIKIYINKDNPEDVVDDTFISWILLPFMMVFVVAGGIMIFFAVRNGVETVRGGAADGNKKGRAR